MTLNPTDCTYIHQHSGSWHGMRITHRPTGVSIQVEGHKGYFDIRRLAEEELERELAKRRL